jgi:hypothetical protein
MTCDLIHPSLPLLLRKEQNLTRRGAVAQKIRCVYSQYRMVGRLENVNVDRNAVLFGGEGQTPCVPPGAASTCPRELWTIIPQRSAAMRLKSTVTCPRCGHRATETMPTDACQFFYHCKGCGERLRPRPGDCCIFCSFGTVRCPLGRRKPIAARRSIHRPREVPPLKSIDWQVYGLVESSFQTVVLHARISC